VIHVLDGAAVLTGASAWMDLSEKIKIVPQEDAIRTFSPSALYAMKAVGLLAPKPMPQAMVCLSGATGMMADQFEVPIRLSKSGTLSGPLFTKNSRKIHPLSLIRSLQNQIPSALSQAFQIHGPVFNSIESATAMAYFLPNIRHLVKGGQRVLLVLASAADRREEKSKRQCFFPNSQGIEGAFAFLLGSSDGVGRVSLHSEGSNDATTQPTQELPWGDPILAAGHHLFYCLQKKPESEILCFQDAWGHLARITWRKC